MSETSGKTKEVEAASVVASLIERYPDPTGRLINVLNDIQELFKYLPSAILDELSSQLDINRAQLDRMARFFDYLSLDPVGYCVVEVCDGTACHTSNAELLVKELEKLFGIECGQTTEDGSITLRKVACVGACGLAPIVVVDGEAYGRIRVQSIPVISHKAAECADAHRKAAKQQDE